MKTLPLKAYIWSIDALKSALITRSFSQKDQLIFLLLSSLVHMLVSMSVYNFRTRTAYSELISVVIFIGAIIYAYICNGGVHGKDFIARYIAVSWVVTIRVLGVLVIPMAVVLIVGERYMSFYLFYYMRITMRILVLLFTYWCICAHLFDLRQRESASLTTEQDTSVCSSP